MHEHGLEPTIYGLEIVCPNELVIGAGKLIAYGLLYIQLSYKRAVRTLCDIVTYKRTSHLYWLIPKKNNMFELTRQPYTIFV